MNSTFRSRVRREYERNIQTVHDNQTPIDTPRHYISNDEILMEIDQERDVSIQLSVYTPHQEANPEYLSSGQSGSSSDDNVEDVVFDVAEELRKWVFKHNVSQNATSDLLKILNCYATSKGLNQELPNDCRSLLKTPRSSEIVEMPPGSYVKLDWLTSIMTMVDSYTPDSTIKLQISIDGLPISKSSNSQFWPVLVCARYGSRQIITEIGIFHGHGKPDVEQYLNAFVPQLYQLCLEGIQFEEFRIPVVIDSFICDAPARSFITGTKGHNAFKGCTKCTVEGRQVDNRTVFVGVGQPRRDEGFRNHSDPHHHNIPTSLTSLPIDMVKDIPLEYMHLVCLGVVRKVLKLLIKEPKSKARISRQAIEELNLRQCAYKQAFPSEFSRKPRSFKELDHFKATEFRIIIMYTASILFDDVLPKKIYNSFKSLHIAMNILARKHLFETYSQYAHELLSYFVTNFQDNFGEKYLSYNVHGLLHITEDCLNHGALDEFSAFKFENRLQVIKNLLKSSHNPLQQIHRRLYERSVLENTLLPQKNVVVSRFSVTEQIYKKVELPSSLIHLSSQECNSTCVLNDNSVVEFIGALPDKKTFLGRKYMYQTPLYTTPISSEIFGFYKCNSLDDIKEYKLSDIKNKCINIRTANQCTILQLL